MTPLAPPAVLAAPPAPALALRTAAGVPASLARPGVVLFWRSDCAPCRLELGDLPALRQAAAPLPLQLVDLDDPGTPPPPGAPQSLRAAAPAAEVLSAWGGAPPRLPLAAAVDAAGRLCARRTGLVGRDRLRAWARVCGGGVAPR